MCNLGQERLHSWCRPPSVRSETPSVGKLVRAVKDLQSNSSTATLVPGLHRQEPVTPLRADSHIRCGSSSYGSVTATQLIVLLLVVCCKADSHTSLDTVQIVSSQKLPSKSPHTKTTN